MSESTTFFLPETVNDFVFIIKFSVIIFLSPLTFSKGFVIFYLLFFTLFFFFYSFPPETMRQCSLLLLYLLFHFFFCLRFQIAGDNTLDHASVEPEIGKSGQVVIELTEGVPPGTQLYFDNWFCSPLLIKKFGEMQICATGTVRQNRLEFAYCTSLQNSLLFLSYLFFGTTCTGIHPPKIQYHTI
jgi:hypothetical protein